MWRDGEGGVRQLPKHIRDALIERMEAATSQHRDGVTGEIDVDGLLQAVLGQLAEVEPEIYDELAALAPMMFAREIYQQRMRMMRYVARQVVIYEAKTGRSHSADYPRTNWTEIAESGSNMFNDEFEFWKKRLTPEVLETQWSYQSGGRWHRKEYGDLTSPDLGTLADKYEAEARAKQATADMLRADKDIFERLQRQFFDSPMPGMTIRDFLSNRSAGRRVGGAA
jgi:hypothetical protein